MVGIEDIFKFFGQNLVTMLKGVMLIVEEYKSLLLQVAFNEELDFLTKFMTVTINCLIFAEFLYFFMPSRV